MPRALLSFATAFSLLLTATIVCWLTGLSRPRHATVLPLRPRPEHTYFLRIDRQHLVLSDQQMSSTNLPTGYTFDTTQFRAFRVFGPALPRGAGVEFGLESPILTPEGVGFRHIHTPIGGVNYHDVLTGTTWQANGFYRALEVPWWSLLLLFSLLPATRLIARRRRRAKTKRGLCPTCGYDLRATPDRCPECGANPPALSRAT